MAKNKNNDQPKILYNGKTKSEIAHDYFIARLFNTTVEQLDIEQREFIERDKLPLTPAKDLPEDDHEYFLLEREKYWDRNFDLHKNRFGPIKKIEQITDWKTVNDLMY